MRSFGSDDGNSEAKELLDQPEGVLANELAVVRKRINKGLVIEKVLSTLKMKWKSVDFVLCIGDDRSDEDMFERISRQAHRGVLSPEAEIGTCTVEVKPSKTKYFLNEADDAASRTCGFWV